MILNKLRCVYIPRKHINILFNFQIGGFPSILRWACNCTIVKNKQYFQKKIIFSRRKLFTFTFTWQRFKILQGCIHLRWKTHRDPWCPIIPSSILSGFKHSSWVNNLLYRKILKIDRNCLGRQQWACGGSFGSFTCDTFWSCGPTIKGNHWRVQDSEEFEAGCIWKKGISHRGE